MKTTTLTNAYRICKDFFGNKFKPYRYINYKIIEVEKSMIYTIQCINTKTTLRYHITELIADKYILERLHPVQACYLGMVIGYNYSLDFNNIVLKSVYGKYSLCSQMRNSDICFVDKESGEQTTMPLQELVRSHFISEFDAIQAFYIGIMMKRQIKKHSAQIGNESNSLNSKSCNLKLIK